jgi:hypothetical protein
MPEIMFKRMRGFAQPRVLINACKADRLFEKKK